MPTLTALAVTAVKGFRLTHPSSVILTAGGAVGDRDFLVVDADDRLLSVTRSGAFLHYWSRFDPATGVLAVGRGSSPELAAPVRLGEPVRAHLFGDRHVGAARVTGPWDAFLSALAGVPVRLVRALEPSGGYDVHPVTLLSEASVAALGTEADGSPLDPRRFRLLLTCAGPGPFEEDSWTGREVALGSAVLRIGVRCRAAPPSSGIPTTRTGRSTRCAGSPGCAAPSRASRGGR